MISTSSSDSETVGSLLHRGMAALRDSGSESARLDAELLLGHVLRVDRASLLAAPEAPVGVDHVARFHEAVARRSKGEPVAYIRGIKEFYGLALSVDPRALIPRPETELLVDLALARLRHMLTERARPASGEPLLVWDVGTGSGAIVVAVAVEARRRGYAGDVVFRATDVSADALGVATINAVSHGVADRIEFGVADLTELAAPAAADLLLANLPYVPAGTVPTLPVAATFEPTGALDGGGDGLDLVRRLLGQLERSIAVDGVALLEIGAGQAEALGQAVSATLPGWNLALHADLAGVPRVAEIERSEARDLTAFSRVVSAADPASVDAAVAALQRGEVIGIPTETVYGVAVLPTPEGLDRLLAAKQRSADKGVQLLIDSLDQALAVAVVTDSATRLAEAFWPGGLTIVLRRRGDVDLPEALGGGRPTLGLRQPDHELPRALARRLGPIAASSANISGEPDATTAQRVAESLGGHVVLIVDDGPVRGGTPSTVVDCSDDALPPRVLREGAISSERIAAALR